VPNVSVQKLNGAPAGPTECLREFIRVVGLLGRIMEPYFARFGISGSQWGLLRTLHRAAEDGESKLRLTDLSNRLLIRPPSVSGAVDRLERAGLVVRDGSTADHRAKHVALTRAGRALIERILAHHEKQVAVVLGAFSAHEQEQFRKLLARFGAHLEGLQTAGQRSRVG
jgi:DNA-binding MarR family transcriptional regulator